MPEFLAQHGYQSQPRGYVTEDDTTRDYWIAQGYPVIPENVLDNKSDFGMDGVTNLESFYWKSYWTNGVTYYRQTQFGLDEWLNAPGVRVVDIEEKPGFTIEEVCKMYYKFKGVRNNIPSPVEIEFPRNSFEKRLRQNQSANVCLDNFTGDYQFYFDGAHNAMAIGDTMLIGKHSGWAWNKGNSDETRQWIPMFTNPYEPLDLSQNNYKLNIGENVSSSYYGYEYFPHYEIARAAYRGYVWEYAYQSDISQGNAVTYEDWTEFGDPDEDLRLYTDRSQYTMIYTHDVSLRPFLHGPENASTSSEISDAFFIQGGSTRADDNTHYNFSRFLNPTSVINAWRQYAGGARNFYEINSSFYSNEADYFNKKFVAQQTTYYGLNTNNERVPIMSFNGANYIKIPITYWTTEVNGITFYNRRTGTAGIENVLNIEPVFHS